MKHTKKALAVGLSACLVWTTGGIAEAVSESSRPRPLQVQLTPPASLGSLADYHFQPADKKAPLVILIQDLHAHYGVQKNIAGILEFLSKRTSFKVAVEGAAGPIDSSVMALFPDKVIRREASEFMMRQGELTGAEYFAIMRGLPKALTGAEDAHYYEVHRDLFRKTFAERDSLVQSLKAIQADVLPLRATVYSSALRKIDGRLKAFEQGKLSPEGIGAFLEERAASFNLPLFAGYPALSRFLRNPAVDHEIAMDSVYHEIYQLAFRLKRAEAKSPAEKDLVQVEHDLELLLRVANLQATEMEVRDFGPRLNQFVAFADSLLKNAPVSVRASKKNLRELISSSIDYYVMAFMRNKPMVENTLALIARGPATQPAGSVQGAPPIAVLVAGGFHTVPITHLLKERNASYIVITPTIDKITEADHDLYIKRLNGQFLTDEEILAAAAKKNTPALLSRLGLARGTRDALAVGIQLKTFTRHWLTYVRARLGYTQASRPIQTRVSLPRKRLGEAVEALLKEEPALARADDDAFMQRFAAIYPDLMEDVLPAFGGDQKQVESQLHDFRRPRIPREVPSYKNLETLHNLRGAVEEAGGRWLILLEEDQPLNPRSITLFRTLQQGAFPFADRWETRYEDLTEGIRTTWMSLVLNDRQVRTFNSSRRRPTTQAIHVLTEQLFHRYERAIRDSGFIGDDKTLKSLIQATLVRSPESAEREWVRAMDDRVTVLRVPSARSFRDHWRKNPNEPLPYDHIAVITLPGDEDDAIEVQLDPTIHVPKQQQGTSGKLLTFRSPSQLARENAPARTREGLASRFTFMTFGDIVVYLFFGVSGLLVLLAVTVWHLARHRSPTPPPFDIHHFKTLPVDQRIRGIKTLVKTTSDSNALADLLIAIIEQEENPAVIQSAMGLLGEFQRIAQLDDTHQHRVTTHLESWALFEGARQLAGQKALRRLAAGEPPKLSVGKPKALIVDDEELNVMLLKQILESIGYDVETAPEGREALEKFRGDIFDVLLTDGNLWQKKGDLNGDELIRETQRLLKQNPRPDRPLLTIFMTGGDQEMRDKLEAEVEKEGYPSVYTMGKPIDFPTLDRLITEHKLARTHTSPSSGTMLGIIMTVLGLVVGAVVLAYLATDSSRPVEIIAASVALLGVPVIRRDHLLYGEALFDFAASSSDMSKNVKQAIAIKADNLATPLGITRAGSAHLRRRAEGLYDRQLHEREGGAYRRVFIEDMLSAIYEDLPSHYFLKKPLPKTLLVEGSERTGSSVLDVPKQVDGYTIGRRLNNSRPNGRSGVYMARDQAGTPFVIRILESGTLADPRFLLNEQRALRHLPNVKGHRPYPRIAKTGTLPDGRPYTVTDFISDPSLEDFKKLLDDQPEHERVRTTLRIGMAIARELELIHEAGVIHGDIAPDHTLFEEEDGVMRITFNDFEGAQIIGVARKDRLQKPVSNPDFTAPEIKTYQALPTVSSDIYSVGAIMKYLLTRDGQTLDDLEDIKDVKGIIAQATADKPEERFVNANTLRLELMTALTQRKSTSIRTIPAFRRLFPTVVASIMLAAATLVGASNAGAQTASSPSSASSPMPPTVLKLEIPTSSDGRTPRVVTGRQPERQTLSVKERRNLLGQKSEKPKSLISSKEFYVSIAGIFLFIAIALHRLLLALFMPISSLVLQGLKSLFPRKDGSDQPALTVAPAVNSSVGRTIANIPSKAPVDPTRVTPPTPAAPTATAEIPDAPSVDPTHASPDSEPTAPPPPAPPTAWVSSVYSAKQILNALGLTTGKTAGYFLDLTGSAGTVAVVAAHHIANVVSIDWTPGRDQIPVAEALAQYGDSSFGSGKKLTRVEQYLLDTSSVKPLGFLERLKAYEATPAPVTNIRTIAASPKDLPIGTDTVTHVAVVDLGLRGVDLELAFLEMLLVTKKTGLIHTNTHGMTKPEFARFLKTLEQKAGVKLALKQESTEIGGFVYILQDKNNTQIKQAMELAKNPVVAPPVVATPAPIPAPKAAQQPPKKIRQPTPQPVPERSPSLPLTLIPEGTDAEIEQHIRKLIDSTEVQGSIHLKYTGPGPQLVFRQKVIQIARQMDVKIKENGGNSAGGTLFKIISKPTRVTVSNIIKVVPVAFLTAGMSLLSNFVSSSWANQNGLSNSASDGSLGVIGWGITLALLAGVFWLTIWALRRASPETSRVERRSPGRSPRVSDYAHTVSLRRGDPPVSRFFTDSDAVAVETGNFSEGTGTSYSIRPELHQESDQTLLAKVVMTRTVPENQGERAPSTNTYSSLPVDAWIYVSPDGKPTLHPTFLSAFRFRITGATDRVGWRIEIENYKDEDKDREKVRRKDLVRMGWVPALGPHDTQERPAAAPLPTVSRDAPTAAIPGVDPNRTIVERVTEANRSTARLPAHQPEPTLIPSFEDAQRRSQEAERLAEPGTGVLHPGTPHEPPAGLLSQIEAILTALSDSKYKALETDYRRLLVANKKAADQNRLLMIAVLNRVEARHLRTFVKNAQVLNPNAKTAQADFDHALERVAILQGQVDQLLEAIRVDTERERQNQTRPWGSPTAKPESDEGDTNTSATGKNSPTHAKVNKAIQGFHAAGAVEELSEAEVNEAIATISEFDPDLADRMRAGRAAGRYRVYVYGTNQTKFLTRGQHSHAGIHTGAIHIAKGEYLKLKDRFQAAVAARIAHEALEIWLWEQEASRQRRSLESMRAWIKSNLVAAKMKDRLFHGQGLRLERKIHTDRLERILGRSLARGTRQDVESSIGSDETIDDPEDVDTSSLSKPESFRMRDILRRIPTITAAFLAAYMFFRLLASRRQSALSEKRGRQAVKDGSAVIKTLPANPRLGYVRTQLAKLMPDLKDQQIAEMNRRELFQEAFRRAA
jgi:CheY-like chemotaxis protein/serine/threonine protein kinase